MYTARMGLPALYSSYLPSWNTALLLTGATTLYLLRRYFAGGVCRSKKRLDGKTVIITGASSGIGKETAKDLAQRGAKVILACRNPVAAKDTTDEIIKITGNTQVIPLKLDVSSLNSVRDFAETVIKNESSLDILINNAGVFYTRGVTEDGIDLVFATNFLGHFLLTYLLLDKLKSSAPARIINVSSKGYTMTNDIDWDMVKGRSTKYDHFKSYAQSKLAMILFTQELQRQLEGSGVSVFSLHPGMVRTSMFRTFPPYTNPILGALQWPIRLICQKTPKEGAQTVIYCAVADIENFSGSHFSDCGKEEIKDFAKDHQKAKQLWTKSLQLCSM